MLVRCALVALDFLLLDVRPFWLATLLFAATNAALIALWGPAETGRDVRRSSASVASGFSRTVVALVAIALLMFATRTWLAQILFIPTDPQRADMLVVIQLGIRRLLQGRNPYTMYQVPWSATLPYGPVMWAPMIVPYVLHADVRFATVAGALVVPTICALAAMRAPDARRAAACLLVLAAFAASPDLRRFMAIGHTPAYWPLLPLFAWLVHRERWVGAAVACGLLIVARTTMVSMAPVLLAAVWIRARPRTPAAAAALAAAVVLPLLPFAIANPHSFVYAFYGSYQAVIKGFVWTSTTWVQNTIGITGPLLARGWRAAIEPVQVAAMVATFALAWRRLRQGDAALPWMAASLLVFSMTTLWPVVYLYFDLFVLLASAAIVEAWPGPSGPLFAGWAKPLAAAIAVLLVVAVATIPARAELNVGDAAVRPYLYAGFSGDEHTPDRDFAWVDGTRATVLLPALLPRDSSIRIACDAYVSRPAEPQRITAALNGTLLGTIDLTGGWRTVSFRAPARAWLIGTNQLDLYLSTATAPRDLGEGADSRRLSVAIDRVAVTPP